MDPDEVDPNVDEGVVDPEDIYRDDGGLDDAPPPAGETPPDAPDESVVDPVEPVEPEAAKQSTVALDPASLQAIAQAMGRAPDAPASAASEAQLTPQQLEEMFKPVRVTKQTLTALGFEEPTDEQVKGFQALSEQIAQHAIRTAHYLQQRQAQELTKSFEPLQQLYVEQQAQKAKDTFFAKYPALKSYDRYVALAAQSLSQTTPTGQQKTDEQLMKEVADSTIELLKGANPDFSLSANPSAPPVPKQVVKPAARMGGGRSPTAGTGSGGDNFNPDADIYN